MATAIPQGVHSLCAALICAALSPKLLQPYIEHFADCKDKLVYLTADSENELQQVSAKSSAVQIRAMPRGRSGCWLVVRAPAACRARAELTHYRPSGAGVRPACRPTSS